MDDKQLISKLLIVGTFAVFGVFWYCVAMYAKKHSSVKEKKSYDERQIAEQRQAYRYAFFTLVAYLIVYSFLDLLGIGWCENAYGICCGITLSVVVFSIFCIFHDAFFNIRDSKASIVICWNLLGLSQLGIGLGSGGLNDGVLFTDGCITSQGIHLLFAIWVVVVDVCLLMKRKMDRSEAQSFSETD